MSNDVIVKAGKTTADDVKAMLEAQLQSAYQQAQTRQKAEIAEPEGTFAWDVLCRGPIQPGAGIFPGATPLLPNQIIRVGEQANVEAVLLFGPSFQAILSLFNLSAEITYSTGELKKWVLGPASLQAVKVVPIPALAASVVDVFSFVADQEGLYEMNISVRILGCDGSKVAPFAGFARRFTKVEPSLFQPQPLTTFDTGLKFMVYA